MPADTKANEKPVDTKVWRGQSPSYSRRAKEDESDNSGKDFRATGRFLKPRGKATRSPLRDENASPVADRFGRGPMIPSGYASDRPERQDSAPRSLEEDWRGQDPGLSGERGGFRSGSFGADPLATRRDREAVPFRPRQTDNYVDPVEPFESRADGQGAYDPFSPNGYEVNPSPLPPTPTYTPLDIYATETRTGRIMFGATVNSDAGLLGQVSVTEQNFDILRVPRSWNDFIDGSAFRGRGQGLNIQLQPGNRVSRYLVSFSDPYVFGTDISASTSASYFQRNYFDWFEDRIGGRVAAGYRLTPDLSASLALNAQDVKIHDIRVPGVPALERVRGSNDLYSGRLTLVHDTRDNTLIATEGHYVELAYEQAFGEFSYPRAEIDARQFVTLFERPDGTGRQVLGLYFRTGFSGTDTPVFENYFLGGYSTLRGFQFRGVGPIDSGVRVGGRFMLAGSVEYMAPITADDMIKGVLFVDYGTVQNDVQIANMRVAPGFGLLLQIPALGPAPLALNFAIPVSSEPGDRRQSFSFFMGASR